VTIDEESIRVMTRDSSNGRAAIYSARGPGDMICFAARMPTSLSSFTCPAEGAGNQALVFYTEFGGEEQNVVSHASLLGVTRSDVERIAVETEDGRVLTVPLNRWRAFRYEAGAAPDVPVRIRAYGEGGAVIETATVGATPLEN